MRIMVTGYIDTEDTTLSPDYFDPSHDSGLSNKGYEAFYSGNEQLPVLDDLDFSMVRES